MPGKHIVQHLSERKWDAFGCKINPTMNVYDHLVPILECRTHKGCISYDARLLQRKVIMYDSIRVGLQEALPVIKSLYDCIYPINAALFGILSSQFKMHIVMMRGVLYDESRHSGQPTDILRWVK